MKMEPGCPEWLGRKQDYKHSTNSLLLSSENDDDNGDVLSS